MNKNLEELFEPGRQSSLADEIVAMTTAVLANISSPESAARALKKSREDSLSAEQRSAAAALQAYGVRSAADVFTSSLEPEAGEGAEKLRQALESGADDTLALLESTPEAGREFKSRMCFAIASKCAELVAAEIDRAKNGPITILNENDAKVFEAQHAQHLQQRTQSTVAFLSSLPARFPSFGTNLFAAIRRDVQRQIQEKHKRPDIHASVAALFDDAVSAMPPQMRAQVAPGPAE